MGLAVVMRFYTSNNGDWARWRRIVPTGTVVGGGRRRLVSAGGWWPAAAGVGRSWLYQAQNRAKTEEEEAEHDGDNTGELNGGSGVFRRLG